MVPVTVETWVDRAGNPFELRSIESADYPLLASFARRLSFRTRYFRYGRGNFALSEDEIRRMCSPDPAHSANLIVLRGVNDQRSIVGLGRIVFEPGQNESELTLTVSDSWQRHGVGRRLLGYLIAASRKKGHATIFARILATNRPMLTLLERQGFTVSDSTQGSGVKRAELPL